MIEKNVKEKEDENRSERIEMDVNISFALISNIEPSYAFGLLIDRPNGNAYV